MIHPNDAVYEKWIKVKYKKTLNNINNIKTDLFLHYIALFAFSIYSVSSFLTTIS